MIMSLRRTEGIVKTLSIYHVYKLFPQYAVPYEGKCLTSPGQNIFFYLNHPIRFVCVVGLIVARTDVYKRTILTLDDSSGATIDIVVLKADPNHQTPGQQEYPEEEDEEEQVPTTETKPQQQQQQQCQPEKELHLTNTTQATLDISRLTPGTVVKFKGTLSNFRSRMQLHLERFFPIPDTNAEMRFLSQRIRFLVEVLSVPWVLSEEEITGLHHEAEHEEERVELELEQEQRRRRKRVEREERDQRRIQRMWEKEEKAREKDAVSCQDAGRRVMWELERRKRLRRDDS